MKIDYSDTDWTRSDHSLSLIYGVTKQAIHHARKRLGAPSRSKLDWDAVDWTKSNNRLAVELGYSRTYVAEKRWRLQKPSALATKENKLPEWAVAKLSERKTVHEWLNAKGVPTQENRKPLCLLRRLAIALQVHD